MVRRTLHSIATGALLAFAALALGSAWAHPGGSAKDGAHRDRSTGERHWHLEIPCADPCNAGIVPHALLDHLDPAPDECPELLDSILTEASKSYWNRSELDIAEWTVDGIRAGCWRVPRAPPAGGVALLNIPALRAAAIGHLIGIEGGFVDDPDDSGGATRWGITEAVARAEGYRGPMSRLPRPTAEAIYVRQYWNKLRLDDVARICPHAAVELLESGVNCGPPPAGRWLQVALNTLNNRGQRWPDIAEDGGVGRGTIAALTACARETPNADKLLATMLNVQQGAHYIELCRGARRTSASCGAGSRAE